MIIFWLFKNNIEKYHQKTTWDDVGAHSAIPAEHVQSQVARATANILNNFNIMKNVIEKGLVMINYFQCSSYFDI